MSASCALVNTISYILITIVFIRKFCGIFDFNRPIWIARLVRDKNKSMEYQFVTDFFLAISSRFVKNN